MNKATIMRRWSSRIRTSDEDAFGDWLCAVALTDHRSMSGNIGAQILTRNLGDGTSEVTMLSWWSSMKAVAAFDPGFEQARYFAKEGRYLLDKPGAAEHYRIAGTIGDADGRQHLLGQNDINY